MPLGDGIRVRWIVSHRRPSQAFLEVREVHTDPMDFYKHYPMMRPYVGKSFYARSTPSLLLIGESHYLLPDSTQHLSNEKWYKGSSDALSAVERDYINIAALIANSRAESFSNKAHSIWRNSLREINEYGPQYADYTGVAEDIAFYNFFLRPAPEGKSLAVSARDVDYANEAFCAHQNALQPTAVVFLSRLAYKHFHPPAQCSVPVISTPHPGCAWWHRSAQNRGNKSGREILTDFVQTLNWPRGLDSR